MPNKKLLLTSPDAAQSVLRPLCLLSGLAAEFHVGRQPCRKMGMGLKAFVRHLEFGLLVPPSLLGEVGSGENGQPTIYERLAPVPGLEQPMQFFRMIVCYPPEERGAEYLIISAYPPRLSEQPLGPLMPLLAEFAAHASIFFIVSNREGWAEVIPESAEASIAAAVAAVKVRYGWDESIPIVVKVGSLCYAVRESEDGMWVADLSLNSESSE